MVTPWSPTVSNPRWLHLGMGGRCPHSPQGWVEGQWGGSHQAEGLVSSSMGRVRSHAVSQHPATPGHCKSFLSFCRQRRAEFALGKCDSTNPHLSGAAKGLQGRWDVRKRRKISSAMPSVSPVVLALHPLPLPSSTSRHYSGHNPDSVPNPGPVSPQLCWHLRGQTWP